MVVKERDEIALAAPSSATSLSGQSRYITGITLASGKSLSATNNGTFSLTNNGTATLNNRSGGTATVNASYGGNLSVHNGGQATVLNGYGLDIYTYDESTITIISDHQQDSFTGNINIDLSDTNLEGQDDVYVQMVGDSTSHIITNGANG